MENNNGKQILNIPTAIIIAGAIISISILFTKTSQVKSVKAPEKAGTFEQQFKAVTTEDHIFGNPNAKIKIVEYSDTSCPYCKLFHNTMKLVMEEYCTQMLVKKHKQQSVRHHLVEMINFGSIQIDYMK